MSQNFSYSFVPAKNNPISTVHHSAQDDMMQGNANKKKDPHSWKLSLLHPRMEEDYSYAISIWLRVQIVKAIVIT